MSDKLKRSKRCINSLDRSPGSTSSSCQNNFKIRSSAASEEDYKEWFDRFDNHISPNLTLQKFDDHFDFDDEEEHVKVKCETNKDGAEDCVTDESSRDVSISVTLNLRKQRENSFPSTIITKSEQPHQNQRRLSIVPSTEDQHQSYVSILHPENFTEIATVNITRTEEYCQKISYNEWIKKIVDHQSSHIATSDSDSDSDVSLDEISMLPLFCKSL